MVFKLRASAQVPSLPSLLDRKIYKTGQTRGADDDVIYQNRVSRSSTVLIPYSCWEMCAKPQDGTDKYENGFIVLISPAEYFGTPKISSVLAKKGLSLGSNAVVFYETREQWNAYNPLSKKWRAAQKRTNPLGGQYVARVPATTANEDGESIIHGFESTSKKGAGIRVYEYASAATISSCRIQLEGLFWLCADAEKVASQNGMKAKDVPLRKEWALDNCEESGLLDMAKLTEARIVNSKGRTICPLCLEELSGQGFFSRMAQAEGRDVPDITVTQLNLFHIAELRVGVLNHRPYNVGWGHHHCNVVVKDSGIIETLEWMKSVIARNVEQGYLAAKNKSN